MNIAHENIPLDLTSAVSTHGLVPGMIRCTVGMELPACWVGDFVASDKQARLRAFGRGACIIGCSTGAAILMHALDGGGVGAGAGLIIGAAVGALAVYGERVSMFSFAGPGTKLEMKVEALAQNAEDAKKLAQLSVEAAFLIANRPSGVLGGGALNRNDFLRMTIADRLSELGFSKEEGSNFARFDDPHIANRVIRHLLVKRTEKSPAGGEMRAQEVRSALLAKKNVMPNPADVESILGDELLKDASVRDAFEFYRDWHASKARLYFTIENIERLKDTS